MRLLKHNISHLLVSILLISCFVLPCGEVNAQDYKEKITKDSIKISYKWRKEKKLKKDSPYVLMLQLENISSRKVTVDFSVLFYWKAQLHSSSALKEYCLKPGKKIEGKKWGLAFNSTVFSINEYLDPMFSWYIEDFEIKEGGDCNPRLKLKLEPAYP